IRTNLTTLHLHLKLDADSMAVTSPDQGTEGWSPDYQWSVRSSVDLPHDLDFDLFLRHVDELPTLGVERYTALDGRLAWRASPTVQIELVGRNLTDSDSVEFVTSFINTASTVPGRSVHATVFWSF
ncbi:MAG: hypothetical protein OEV00_05230, partial [Acidobacteriota bacterium]|nr:hypothetical protein [Acidobacteriota bacterium]